MSQKLCVNSLWSYRDWIEKKTENPNLQATIKKWKRTRETPLVLFILAIVLQIIAVIMQASVKKLDTKA